MFVDAFMQVGEISHEERSSIEGLVAAGDRSLEEVLEKVNRYSSLSAQQMDAAGRRGGILTAISHGLGAFILVGEAQSGFVYG